MEALESEKLDLEEQIQSLEEQLQQSSDDKRVTSQQDFTGTLQAKDQYIEKLEAEIKSVQQDISKLVRNKFIVDERVLNICVHIKQTVFTMIKISLFFMHVAYTV